MHDVGIDATTFRHVLGHWATGVSVVTACVDGTCSGLTVNAFSSLSLDPPLVLVCIDRSTGSHEIITAAGSFAIIMLDEQSEHLSRQFASHTADKFAGVGYHFGTTGAPVLDDALAVIECKLVESLPGGDHTIFVGEVVAATARDDRRPLLYFRGGYRQID